MRICLSEVSGSFGKLGTPGCGSGQAPVTGLIFSAAQGLAIGGLASVLLPSSLFYFRKTLKTARALIDAQGMFKAVGVVPLAVSSPCTAPPTCTSAAQAMCFALCLGGCSAC
eukprot:1160226-Pelagomonas_calceolata.AAC.1